MQWLHWVYVALAVILLFGASVFVHEFGHFWVARRRGLKVEAFSIGFGPKLFGWTRNGVAYAWRLIPAGGFVALPQMLTSEALEGRSQTTEPLAPASPGSKVLVALAGPAMNAVFAFAIASALYFLGMPVPLNPAIIGGVEPGSAEAKLGLRAGDRIVAVQNKPVHSWDDVQTITAMAPTNRLAVTIAANGATNTFLLAAKVNPDFGLKLLNLEPSTHPVIQQVQPGSAAQAAGLKPGDEVLDFDGVPVLGEQQLVGLIQKRPGKPSSIQIKRAQNKVSLQVIPKLNPQSGKGLLGVIVAPSAVTVYTVRHPGPTPWHLVGQVCQETFDTFRALLHSRRTGVGVGDLSGPPGILAMLAVEVNADYRLALRFMVLLNISLAMLNLLPLPVLDGGHILTAVIEKIRGRPLNPLLQQYATMTFVMLLISFMLYVSFNDIVRRFPLFKSMFNQQVQVQSGSPASNAPSELK